MELTLEQESKRGIAPHEGRRRHVYVDTEGHPSVGVGLNLDREGAKRALELVGADYAAVRAGKADLTEHQIDLLFAADWTSARHSAEIAVPSFAELPRPIQVVLIDMAFNMGLGSATKGSGLLGFHKMIRACVLRDWAAMAFEMSASKWAKQVPLRADDLIAKVLACANADELAGDDLVDVDDHAIPSRVQPHIEHVPPPAVLSSAPPPPMRGTRS